MNQERVLVMYFLDEEGKTKSLTLRNVKEDLGSEEVLQAMQTIIEKDVLDFKNPLTEVVGAKITTTSTNELFDDRK